MNMNTKQNTKKIRGMTAFGLLVGLGLLAGASLLFVEVVKIFNISTEGGRVKAEFEASHSLAFQYLRKGAVQSLDWNQHLSAQELACLQGIGTSCDTLAQNVQPMVSASTTSSPLLQHFRAPGSSSPNNACSGVACGIRNQLDYQLVECTSTKCAGVNLIASTSFDPTVRSPAALSSKQSSLRIDAETALGVLPTMGEGCSARVQSLNIHKQDLSCDDNNATTVCTVSDVNNPLSISGHLSQTGIDCRSLASINCEERQALGLMSANAPECKDAPPLEIYSAENWEDATEEVTFRGVQYETEQCDACQADGTQECRTLQIRKCYTSTGTQVNLSYCTLNNTTFEQLIRYTNPVVRTCVVPSVPVTPSTPTGPMTPPVVATPQPMTPPRSPAPPPKPEWVYALKFLVTGGHGPARMVYFNEKIKGNTIQFYTRTCTKSSGGRGGGACTQYSAYAWRDVGLSHDRRENGYYIYHVTGGNVPTSSPGNYIRAKPD